MKKNLCMGLVLCMMFFLISCGRGEEKESAGDSYVEKAQAVIKLFHEEKSKEILDWSSPEMKAALTEEQLKMAFDAIKQAGEFEEFKDGAMTETDQNGRRFFVVVQNAKYKEKEITYTVTFEKEDLLSGFFFK